MKRLALIALLAAGCAAPNVILVHPRTGDIRQCRASATGRHALTAVLYVNNCVTQHQALGYKRADELTPAERDKLRPTRGPDFKGEYKIK